MRLRITLYLSGGKESGVPKDCLLYALQVHCATWGQGPGTDSITRGA